MLAAATQRTSRIRLGTAVIPLGWENPLRLAEDLATVDLLSGGRLQPGISVGRPHHYDRIAPALHPDTAGAEEFGHRRAERLLSFLRGEPATDFSGVEGIEVYSDRVQPVAPGLAERVWYGAGSLGSARWAGGQGLNLLTSNVVRAEESEDFAEIQRSQILAFRAEHPEGAKARVSQGLVVIPTDGATAAQRAKYVEYVRGRTARTTAPQGPGRIMYAEDLVGTSAEIAERLSGHAAYREVEEVAFALPFSSGHEDYVQILTDIATGLAPALGWRPIG